MKKAIILTAFASLIINAILLVWIVAHPLPSQPADKEPTQFPYLSLRIFAENQNDILINFTLLREKLRAYEQNHQTILGVYFEYLPSGVSIGLNEKEPFTLASLLKVPLIMNVYKQISLGKLDKSQELTLTEKDLDSKYGTLWKKGAGSKITVEEAIKLALQESDNTAAKALQHNCIPSGGLEEVFDYLDIPKEIELNSPVVTAKNYSSIFRSLYLSSYLEYQYSNEILKILTDTNYQDKLPAGVPSEIRVAHKIGTYEFTGQKTAYTDCGIVYVPKRPYILCLMAKDSQENATAHMRDISRLVYQYVISFKGSDL